MRYLRYAFLGVLAICLITVALANRDPVVLALLPGPLAELLGVSVSVTLPLFAVIYAAIAAGLLIGFFWEWLREGKHRAEASRRRREVRQLEREVRRVKGERDKDKDEVLALLEDGAPNR